MGRTPQSATRRPDPAFRHGPSRSSWATAKDLPGTAGRSMTDATKTARKPQHQPPGRSGRLVTTDPTTHESRPATVQEAVQLQASAAVRRAEANAAIADGDRVGGQLELVEADAMDAAAA